jgi:hypothetical protein
MTDRPDDPLQGISDSERQIMGRLLRQPPEQHKAALKPDTPQAAAQRRRRQKEKEAAATAVTDA